MTNQLLALDNQAPDESQPEEVCQAFNNQVWRTWYDVLHLNPAWVSSPEAEALASYLYANELIVQCKEAAVRRVSPQVWAGIEERMLTVRKEG